MPMKEGFLESVKKRHTIRKYSNEHISDETINQILSLSATFVPPWRRHLVEFIVIRDRKTMAELTRRKAVCINPLACGDAVIVPIMDKRDLRSLLLEESSVVSNCTLHAAEYYGVTAYWIGRQGCTKAAEDDIRDLLGIPDYYRILNIMSLGVLDKTPGEQDLQATIYYEKFR